MRNHPGIGPEISQQLQTAFDFYNTELWGGRLPPCVVLCHRHRGALGYFWAERWSEAEDSDAVHEIALHPDYIRQRGVRDVLSTLVHEMCHLQQQAFGKPSRSGYHNKEWAQMMLEVGLIPTTTGDEGGKMTGQKVTHMIRPGGPFDLATQRLLDLGYTLTWSSCPPPKTASKSGSRVKYECDECGAAAWGKAELRITCADCDAPMEAQQ